MAHFAQLNGQTVTQVIVVNNDIIGNASGLNGEAEGIAFCQSLLGAETEWAQTSYNASFRGKFAGIGDTYDPIKDEFVVPAAPAAPAAPTATAEPAEPAEPTAPAAPAEPAEPTAE